MTDQEYRDHPAIGREDLLLLAHSAELFHAIQSGGIDADEIRKVREELDPEAKKRDHFDLGDATHRIIFQPETLEQRFCGIPPEVLASNGAKSTKAWHEFRAEREAAGQIPISDGKMALARMLAAKAEKTIGPLLFPDAIHETPIFWTEHVEYDGEVYPVECKCKPDYLFARGEIGVMLDLKTCRDVEDFRQSIRKFRYWMQVAHYRAAFKSQYGFLPMWYFAAVGKRLPFKCKLIRLDDESEAAAESRRQELLIDLVRRRVTGDWSDPDQDGIETVSVQVA